MNLRVHLIVEGLVQGVWFRDSTRRKALALGVSGWVRNCRGGSVEVLAEGPADAVNTLVAWCHHGPPAASVSRVVKEEEPWRGDLETFEIRF